MCGTERPFTTRDREPFRLRTTPARAQTHLQAKIYRLAKLILNFGGSTVTGDSGDDQDQRRAKVSLVSRGCNIDARLVGVDLGPRTAVTSGAVVGRRGQRLQAKIGLADRPI